MGLGAGGFEHARPEHAEFELADAALHTQQQPIVGPTRVVHAVQIDDPGLDQTAQLQQMVPVASVAGKARGVEAQHGADFAGAQPRHEAIEAGSGHHAAGGAAEVIVDDFHLRKPTAASFLHEVVLATLALQVGLNLRLGGLAHIDDGLAPKHRGRQQIRVRHRHPLPPATPAACSSRIASCVTALLARSGPCLERRGLERHAQLALGLWRARC